MDLLNRHEEAYSTLKSAERVFTEHPQLLVLKLYLQIKLGFILDARRTLVVIEKVQIETPLLKRLEGELALAMRDFDKAEALLSSYYKTSPSMEAASLLAEVLKSKGKTTQAADLLINEFENSKKSFKGLFTLAKFFSSIKQYEQSNEYYFQVLEHRPENIIALNNLASNMLNQDNLIKANDYAEQAVILAPDMPAVLDTIGWIKIQLGENRLGLSYLQKAHNLAPNSTEIRVHYEQAKEITAK